MRTIALSKLASSQVLLAVAGVAVAGSALAGAGTMAAFTRTTSNTANTFQAATVDLTTTPSGGSAGGAIFQTTLTIDKIIPGDSFTRNLTVHNSGDVAEDVALTVAALTSSDAGVNALVDNGAKSLKLYIASCTDNTFGTCTSDLYGTSAAPGSPVLTNQSIAPALAAGADKFLKVYVALPSTVVDDGTGTSIQGKGNALTFTWKATQNGSGAAR